MRFALSILYLSVIPISRVIWLIFLRAFFWLPLTQKFPECLEVPLELGKLIHLVPHIHQNGIVNIVAGLWAQVPYFMSWLISGELFKPLSASGSEFLLSLFMKQGWELSLRIVERFIGYVCWVHSIVPGSPSLLYSQSLMSAPPSQPLGTSCLEKRKVASLHKEVGDLQIESTLEAIYMTFIFLH